LSQRVPLFAVLIFAGLIGCAIYVLAANRYCPMEEEISAASVADLHIHKEQRGLDNGEAVQKYKYLAADLPFILQFIEAKAQQDKRDAELPHQSKKSPSWISKFFCDAKVGDVAIAFFTWCLVIVGALQARRLRQTIATMEQTERPFMVFSNFKISNLTSPPNSDGKVRLLLNYGYINHGRSPAFFRRLNQTIATGDELPKNPTYEVYESNRFVISVGGGYVSTTPVEFFLDGEDVKKLFLGEYNLWVYGHFEYTGISPTPHNHRFALRMIFDGGDESVRFYPDGRDSYWENS
jgi:hypothetical protein